MDTILVLWCQIHSGGVYISTCTLLHPLSPISPIPSIWQQLHVTLVSINTFTSISIDKIFTKSKCTWWTHTFINFWFTMYSWITKIIITISDSIQFHGVFFFFFYFIWDILWIIHWKDHKKFSYIIAIGQRFFVRKQFVGQ